MCASSVHVRERDGDVRARRLEAIDEYDEDLTRIFFNICEGKCKPTNAMKRDVDCNQRQCKCRKVAPGNNCKGLDIPNCLESGNCA